jgi:hypothetical protein
MVVHPLFASLRANEGTGEMNAISKQNIETLKQVQCILRSSTEFTAVADELEEVIGNIEALHEQKSKSKTDYFKLADLLIRAATFIELLCKK